MKSFWFYGSITTFSGFLLAAGGAFIASGAPQFGLPSIAVGAGALGVLYGHLLNEVLR